MDPVLTLTDEPDPALREAIYENFRAHSASQGFAADFRLLSIEARRHGALLGGLQGRTGRGWLYVELLALPAAEQGAGLGRRLLAMAEEEAVRRGCHGAYLYTFAFQAPAFYEKLGYREFGRLADADPLLDRVWLSKRLP